MPRKLGGRFDVDPGHHAVASDIGVDDRFEAVVLELHCKIGHIVSGHLAPAIGRDLAALCVERDDHVAAEGAARIVQEAGVFYRSSANDDKADAVVDVALDDIEIAQATAQLNGQLLADRLDDFLDHRFVDRPARARAIQIDDMQTPRALIAPVTRHRDRVFGEHGDVGVHVALAQAHTASVFQINGRDQQHGGCADAALETNAQGFQRVKFS